MAGLRRSQLVTGSSANIVRVRLSRARARLKRQLGSVRTAKRAPEPESARQVEARGVERVDARKVEREEVHDPAERSGAAAGLPAQLRLQGDPAWPVVPSAGGRTGGPVPPALC